MRGSIYGVLALVAVAGLALPVAGQVERSRTATVTLGNSMHAARLPYTAEYKITRVQRLNDGTTITQESTETIALDSQGRRMTARTAVQLLGDQTRVTRVSVFDPVAHTNSSWSVPGQKATVTAMPAPGAARTGCATTGVTGGVFSTSTLQRVQREKPTVEDLGVETIQGVEAHGRRTTMMTPAGAIGNNEPLMRTSEMWTAVAPGLRGLLVREVSEDPQTGQMTKELTNLSQSDPDPSVFQPPAGYEIVNKEAGVGCPSSSAVIAEPPPPPPAAESAAEPAPEPEQ
jgi:hypothetical protein